jgi:hypothetical protein
MDEDESGLELSKSAFTLVGPKAMSKKLWDAYTAERCAVQEAFSTVLLSDKDENDYEVIQIHYLLTLLLIYLLFCLLVGNGGWCFSHCHFKCSA